MYGLSSFTACTVGERVDLPERTSLPDVSGSGSGCGIELRHRYFELTATVFDLPFTCELILPTLTDPELSERLIVTAGDSFAGPLPPRHDTMILSSVLYDWPEQADRRLAAHCFHTRDLGGLLLVTELFLGDDKAGPLHAAPMSLAMFSEGAGRTVPFVTDPTAVTAETVPYDHIACGPSPPTFGRISNATGVEVGAWLRDTGFTDINRHPDPGRGHRGRFHAARDP